MTLNEIASIATIVLVLFVLMKELFECRLRWLEKRKRLDE